MNLIVVLCPVNKGSSVWQKTVNRNRLLSPKCERPNQKCTQVFYIVYINDVCLGNENGGHLELFPVELIARTYSIKIIVDQNKWQGSKSKIELMNLYRIISSFHCNNTDKMNKSTVSTINNIAKIQNFWLPYTYLNTKLSDES